MALTFDATANQSGYPPGTISVSHSLGSGSGNNRILLVGCVTLGPGPHTYSANTYNGTTMNTLVSVTSPSYFGRISQVTVFYLLDSALPASSGSYTCSITCSGPYGGVLSVLSYTAAAQSAPPYVSASNFNNPPLSGIQTTNITVAGSSGSLVDFFGGEHSGTAPAFTPGSGQTTRLTAANNPFITASDKGFSSSGSNSMAQTPDQSYWSYCHAVLECVGVGGAVAATNAAIIGAHF